MNAQERHEAQVKAEQAEERLTEIYSLANLMNAHVGKMSIDQINFIFTILPPLAAHAMCKQISSQN